MPIRNMWSLECGEVLTAEAILEHVKGAEIYFPLHDIGTDLLVMKESSHISIQVKESRYFTEKGRKGVKGSSWHQIHKRKFQRDRNKVNFYVFLTYLPRFGEHKLVSFENKFVVVPTKDLEKLIENKPSGEKEIYSFYFNFDGKKVVENRNEVTDYSEYLDRWDLINNALERQE
jgi:hypothetical protein